MINSPTVLVLGAGASQPYGFPLGAKLKSQIISMLKKQNSEEVKQLIELGCDMSLVNNLLNALIVSHFDTIDSFLEHRPSYRKIGALCIAQRLMRLENKDLLFPKRDWYPLLFGALGFGDPGFDCPISGVITFNYDRSLEHYLHTCIDQTYEGPTKENALKRLARLQIIHVHGQLGPYPAVPYAVERSAQEIFGGATSITLVSDTLDDSLAFQDARKLIGEAALVLFFGFGYHPISLKRLNILSPIDTRKVKGTRFGIDQREGTRIKELFQGGIDLEPHGQTIQPYFNSLITQ